MLVCPRTPPSCLSFDGASPSTAKAGLETQSSAEITNADLADPTSMPPADGLTRTQVLPLECSPGRTLLFRRTHRQEAGSYFFMREPRDSRGGAGRAAFADLQNRGDADLIRDERRVDEVVPADVVELEAGPDHGLLADGSADPGAEVEPEVVLADGRGGAASEVDALRHVVEADPTAHPRSDPAPYGDLVVHADRVGGDVRIQVRYLLVIEVVIGDPPGDEDVLAHAIPDRPTASKSGLVGAPEIS